MIDKKIKEVLEKQISLIKPSEEEERKIDIETEKFVKELRGRLRKKKIKAEVFVGGSLAKGTVIKKDKYDIDIFVRFDKKYKDVSNILSKVLGKAKRIHGSRDYFQIVINGNIFFEIVPVLKINKPEQAENVTDLSYFHVNYLKKQIRKNKGLENEIRLAKSFCYAQNCYGAEGYIRGFSGYALELLVSYYGNFLKFIKAIVAKKGKIVLDPVRFYKSKEEILLELNESKLQSAMIFVDPTFKERNALAALSLETLNKFRQAGVSFLIRPNDKFFEKQDIDKELKRKYKDLIIIQAGTNKQKGDIGGSKLNKFYRFLVRRMERYFEIKFKEFEYLENVNMAKFYFVLKEKKVIVEGPKITSVDHLTNFKKKHKNCYIKKGRAYARERVMKIDEIIENLKKEKIVKEMKIIRVKLIN